MVIAEFHAFYVVGGALAAWAVILAAIGITSHNFPPKGAEKVVIAISAVLVVGSIATAIASGGEKKPQSGEQAGAKNRTGEEGSQPPAPGTGTPAPGTGSQNGQATPGESNTKKPPGGQAAQTLRLAADPSGALKFDKTALSAKAGTVRIVMHNPAPVPHNVSIEGPGGLDQQGKTVPQNGDSQVQAKLKPGKYTFYCSVPGHRQAGMEGTLTVK